MAEITISIEEYRKVLEEKLRIRGVSEEEARQIAGIFATNAADRVISHSILRTVRMLNNYGTGIIVPGRMPQKISGFRAVERYDANCTNGVVAASFCMNRACDLSREYGLGMVALRHANHWMRGGYYGWLAADRGMVGICWTNTRKNMPSWGSAEANTGNNPFIMAVPGTDGAHFVLDSAQAQFSYGKLEVTRKAGKLLPVDGGYDENGNITRDPAAIEKTKRPLPAGFWKGSGMSVLLDAAAALLSDGDNTVKAEEYIVENKTDECDLCQVFIAIDPEALGENNFREVEKSIKDAIHNAKPVTEGVKPRYPGEKIRGYREDAEKNGISVPADAWEKILAV